MLRIVVVTSVAVIGAAGSQALAHHAFVSSFDVQRTIEVEGDITDLRWQNPHVLMTLVTVDGSEWAVESQARNLLERTEIEAAMFSVGTHVALAGYPARSGNGIFALNALLPAGNEVILRAGIEPFFGRALAGRPENILETGVADSVADGIFRVWSMQFAGPGRWRWPDSYPLTPAAAAARDRFDPIADNPLADCGSKGMPWIMEQPFPMELVMVDGNVAMRIEENDVVRVIHLDEPAGQAVAPSPLGYSTGRWDGADLVVETGSIDFPYLNSTGIPLTAQATLVERFSLADDGSRLDYRLSITDPGTFTEPVAVESYWVWRPGETLQTYECVPD